jgi:hypothetical protein
MARLAFAMALPAMLAIALDIDALLATPPLRLFAG